MAYLTSETTFDSSFSIRSILSGIAAHFAQDRAYRRTLNELTKLNDHDLNDLGLSRHDLHCIALESARC